MIRTPILLLLTLVAATSLAACGASDDGSGGRAPDDKAFDAAVKFSRCMRQHGVPMGDPQRGPGGGILMKAGGPGRGGRTTDLGPDNPKFKVAEKACAKFQPKEGGRAPDPAEQARHNDALLDYARCMRSKGINFPDPKISGNHVAIRLGPGVRPDSPKFKAADEACHPILAKVEPKGAGGEGPVAVGPGR